MKAALSGPAALSGLLLISVRHAGILRVPTDYPTIQAALDGAVDGDEVVVVARSDASEWENIVNNDRDNERPTPGS